MSERVGQFGAGRAAGVRRACAFTLVELMVVITVIAIGTALLMPAFGRLLRSVNYANAVNTVSATLGSARALAIRDQRHTAVAFMFDVEREVASVMVLQQQGTGDLDPSVSEGVAVAYRPATGQVPTELPRGTAVYGLALGIEQAGKTIGQRTGGIPEWYSGWKTSPNSSPNGPTPQTPLWVFPMNDARHFTENAPPDVRFHGVDPWEVLSDTAPASSTVSADEAAEAVRHAQTFVIQFAPDGSVVRSPRSGATQLDFAYIEWPNAPVDRSNPSGEPYDQPDQFDPDVPESWNGAAIPPGPPDSPEDRSPNPEVFVRSADQLAVVDLDLLARETRIERPWFVRPNEMEFPKPPWLIDLGYFEDDVDEDNIDDMPKHRLISRWIDVNAEILSFDRYSGKVIRRESP